jgi:hypothetical protein
VVIARPLFASRQTFIGARLGCYVNWGYGFVTWAVEKECTNANTFSPVGKDDSSSGWRVMVRAIAVDRVCAGGMWGGGRCASYVERPTTVDGGNFKHAKVLIKANFMAIVSVCIYSVTRWCVSALEHAHCSESDRELRSCSCSCGIVAIEDIVVRIVETDHDR